MALIRGFMAMSLDGYIADTEGGYGFLSRYSDVDYGFGTFFAGIGTCVFGRATYDQSVAAPGAEWAFAQKARVIVVSRRPLAGAPANVEHWDRGVDATLVARLRGAEGGDVWIVGGGKLQSAFFEMDAIDRMELGIVPAILGDGVPVFTRSKPREQWLELAEVRRFDKGGVILDYRRPPPGALFV